MRSKPYDAMLSPRRKHKRFTILKLRTNPAIQKLRRVVHHPEIEEKVHHHETEEKVHHPEF